MIRIDKIEYYLIRLPLRYIFETSFGRFKYTSSIIVKFSYGDFSGYGEIPVEEGPWYSYETIETALHVSRDFISKIILGKEYNSVEDMYRDISVIRGHNITKTGHEMAFLDLLGKLRKEPLYKLIGGLKDRIEAGVSIGVIGDLNELFKQINTFLDVGYLRIKIKIKPKWDIDVISAIRKYYGDIPLQVDANACYDYNLHSETLHKLDRFDLLMIEQPLHYNDLFYHSKLQKEIKTPICLDESIKSMYYVIAASKLGSCKIINVKPARVGGILETIKINNYTKSIGIPIWIGGLLETGVGKAHLIAAATLDNVKYPSDISGSMRYFEEDIIDPPITVENGYIKVINKPGIGVEVLENRIKKYLVKEFSQKS